MKKYVKSVREYYTLDSGGTSYIPFLSKGNVSGLEYDTNPDPEFDKVFTASSGNEIIPSRKEYTYILADGSYFLSEYIDPDVKPDTKYTHYYVYVESDDSRVSLDKFRIHLPDLKELMKHKDEKFKNTLIFARDMQYKVVDNNGNILEESNS